MPNASLADKGYDVDVIRANFARWNINPITHLIKPLR